MKKLCEDIITEQGPWENACRLRVERNKEKVLAALKANKTPKRICIDIVVCLIYDPYKNITMV